MESLAALRQPVWARARGVVPAEVVVASPFRLHASRQNRLLAVLPRAVWEVLETRIELVELAPTQVLFDAAAPRRDVYFPTSAIVSLLQVMRDGAAAEVAVVGYEGMVDIAAFIGGGASRHRCVVASGGSAFRLRAEVLEAWFNRVAPLRRLLLRYAQSVMAQAEQAAACNRHHSLERQLCRWLLQRFDRSSGATLAVTHETIAGLLGVRREGVTEAAGRLHKAGAIECGRGRILLLDRPLLEARACECYAALKRQTEHLLPDRVAS